MRNNNLEVIMSALPSKKILAEATVAVLKESKEMLKAADDMP